MTKLILAFTLALGASIARAEARSLACSDVQSSEDEIVQLLEGAGPQPQCKGSYYNWGRGGDGWGYCYQWTCNGMVLNGGQPVSSYLCEAHHPSHYNWGRGGDGWGYCYQWTPYGVAMNEGQPVGGYLCEAHHPSHYAWGRGGDGNAYCYQWTPSGVAMNEGQPVSNYLCN